MSCYLDSAEGCTRGTIVRDPESRTGKAWFCDDCGAGWVDC